MKLKSKLKMALSSMALLTAMSSYAFSPASGAWSIDAEAGNSAPGRGFSIEVENEILVITYFGYRADGTSVFYLAAGPMTGNTFTGALSEFKGGTVIGNSYKGGFVQGSPGSVTLSFTTGVAGTITLPGESPKAVSKAAFGYSATADSLLGTYTMTYKMSTSTVADTYTLSQKSGSSTSTGNGMVTNSTNTFICENKISGYLAGAVLCTEATGTSASAPLSAYDDSYIFKMSGDRGTGIGTFYSAQYNYPSHIVRIATRTGKTTGIVEPANSSVFVSSDAGNSLEQARSLNPVRTKDLAKTNEMPNAKNAVQLTEEEQADFLQWIQEAKLLVRQSRLVN